MAAEPVTDELLTEWALDATPLMPGQQPTVEQQRLAALIAEVYTLRQLNADLEDAVEHQRGMYEREHNTVHELQQRIDAALAISATRWHCRFKRQVVDSALIRAALDVEPDVSDLLEPFEDGPLDPEGAY